MFVAACGSASSSEGPAGLGVCNPPSAPVGAQVTCSVNDKGLQDDCTVFFGGTPVEAVLNEEEGTITFTVPPGAPGPRDITFQCGSGDPKAIASDFAVSAPPPPGTAACEDNSDCPGGEVCNGGTCQAPAGGDPGPGPDDPVDPAGDGDDEPPPPPDADGDGVVDASDTCAGTAAGTVVDANGCPIPGDSDGDGVVDPSDSCPGTSAGTAVSANGCPLPLTASITATKMFGTRIGLVKLHWSVQGGETLTHLYLHSNGFYRVPGAAGDLALADDLECKKIDDPVYTNKANGKRRLLVKSSGDDYNDGVAGLNALSQMLDTAQKCVDGANCKGFAGGGTVPTCRIDLKNSNGTFKKSGDIYTRVLVKDAVFTIYARTQTGEEKLIASNPIPVSNVDPSLSFDNLVDEAKIHVSFTAENAIKKAAPLAGCETTTNTFDDKDMGKITLEAKCPVTENQFIIAALGIGDGNSYSNVFRTSIGNPTVEIKDAGEHHCDGGGGNASNWGDCKGTLDIEVKAWRNFTLRQIPTNAVIPQGSGKTTKGIPSLKVYANNGHNREHDISEKNEEAKYTFVDIPRNHEKYKWRGRVTVGGTDYNSEWLNKSYTAEFRVFDSHWSGTYECEVDDCDGGWDPGDCCDGDCEECSSGLVSDCSNHQTTLSFNWDGQHLKEVSSSCGGSFGGGGQPSINEYDYQNGNWTRTAGGTSMNCTITAVTYKNEEITHTVSTSWSDNC